MDFARSCDYHSRNIIMTPPVGLTIFIHLLVIGALKTLRFFGFHVIVPSAPSESPIGPVIVSFFIMLIVGAFLFYVVTNIVLLAFGDSHASWRLLFPG
jgi:hypothetical protein